MPHIRHQLRKNRRERERDKAFRFLEATPHVFDALAASGTTVTNFSMPAGARLALSHSVAMSAEDVTVNITAGRSFSHAALAADENARGNVAEETMEISLTRSAALIAGTFTLYFVDSFGLHKAIATAVFL